MKNNECIFLFIIGIVILFFLIQIQNIYNIPKEYNEENKLIFTDKSIYADKKSIYKDIDNFFNKDDNYYIIYQPLSITIIKEQDYINSYKGQKLLGLKILDLSKHKIDRSDASIIALEDTIIEAKDSISNGSFKHNKINNFYEIKNYDKVMNNLEPISGSDIEDTLCEYLDYYIEDINSQSKIINKSVTSDLLSLFYVLFMTTFIVILIVSLYLE